MPSQSFAYTLLVGLYSEPLLRDERKEQVATSMAARQKKRTDNIAARAERRNDKRKGVKTKPKDKGRPGFEGKSFGKGKGKALPEDEYGACSSSSDSCHLRSCEAVVGE